mmetsp:Transcript_45113/g.84383  ORF Transcript_45113/g.84383 Transcript_45113/m.84383 type:complete len:232 (+) Transcript_45113:683-1378(+)
MTPMAALRERRSQRKFVAHGNRLTSPKAKITLRQDLPGQGSVQNWGPIHIEVKGKAKASGMASARDASAMGARPRLCQGLPRRAKADLRQLRRQHLPTRARTLGNSLALRFLVSAMRASSRHFRNFLESCQAEKRSSNGRICRCMCTSTPTAKSECFPMSRRRKEMKTKSKGRHRSTKSRKMRRMSGREKLVACASVSSTSACSATVSSRRPGSGRTRSKSASRERNRRRT